MVKLTGKFIKIDELEIGTKYTVTLDDKGTTEEHIVLKNGTDLSSIAALPPSDGQIAYKFITMENGEPVDHIVLQDGKVAS